MNIGKFDVMVLVVMGLAVVGMSFVFPQLGLSNIDTDENEIPTLDVASDRFDLVGDSPRRPSSPTEGTLYFDTTESATFSENSVWLNGSTNGGVQMTLLQNASEPNSSDVLLTFWNDTGQVQAQDRVVLTNSTDQGVLSVAGYQIAVEATDRFDGPEYFEVDWRVDDDPRSEGAFSFLGQLYEVAAWGVIWIIWFMTALVEGTLNAIGIIFDVSVFFIDLLMWLITTYTSVVTSAPSWVAIFVALPGIILSVTLGKIVVILIQLLPST